MTIDLTQILNAILGLIAALITAYVIPYIKKKISNEQLSEITSWCKIAVQAAEQLKVTGIINDKKQYVVDFLQSKGFSIDDAVVEATVNELFGKVKEQLYDTSEPNELAEG